MLLKLLSEETLWVSPSSRFVMGKVKNKWKLHFNQNTKNFRNEKFHNVSEARLRILQTIFFIQYSLPTETLSMAKLSNY